MRNTRKSLKGTKENVQNAKYKMPNTKSQMRKGITLIALVITVIILLILAGVTISLAIDGGGLFSKAREAAEGWNAAVRREEDAINDLLERKWLVAWVYKGTCDELGRLGWSNPYFKDKKLGERFGYKDNEYTGEYEGEEYTYTLDPEYTFTSEEKIKAEQAKGSIVFKLYADGELNVSGTGGLPGSNYWASVWTHMVHAHVIEEDSIFDSIDDINYWAITEYLEEHISKVVIEEGIECIEYGYFNDATPARYATSYKFPSTIKDIDEQAFYGNEWIRMLDEERGYYDDSAATEMVDVDINGKTYSLYVDY